MAIRNIDKGTELTLCYLGEKDRFSDIKKRRKILRNYGFVCNCVICDTEDDLGEDPGYLKHYMKLNNILDSQKTLGSKFLEKDEILEQNCSKLIWRIMNFIDAIHNVNPSSQEYKLIFEKLRQLEEFARIKSSF